jgi:hypothetical protein
MCRLDAQLRQVDETARRLLVEAAMGSCWTGIALASAGAMLFACGGTTEESGSGGTSAGGAGGGTASYVASIADCINASDPNPDTCESTTGPNLMSVDSLDAQTGAANHSYVRFDVDDALAGVQVTAIRLLLRTGPNINASSDQSGEVWQVGTFERADLFVAAPTNEGSAPLAESMGGTDPEAIGTSQDVVWSLPSTVAVPNAPLCLGILPASDDGVDYLNANSPTPPTLTVEYE